MTIVGQLWENVAASAGIDGGTPITRLDLTSITTKLEVLPASGPSRWERLTLDALWRHCQERPTDMVMYMMHSKGLFHQVSVNDSLRRHLMRGIIISPCCLDALREGAGFNVCGMRFCPDAHFHFPRNMWVAKCDYIIDLSPHLNLRRK
jgi:hypothetical protein